MGGYHYWKGGDDDPRDQVGVDPTTPAVSGPTAGPPDLDHAIHAAAKALYAGSHWKLNSNDAARVAVEAAAPVLLQATRDRLADLEGEYELTKARFNDFAEEALERDRQRVVQLEDMDRVVSLANAERNEARDRLADLQKRHNDLAATIREWHLECIRLERERDEAEARLAAALDGPAAQEDGG